MDYKNKGRRVELISTDDQYTSLKSGDKGTYEFSSEVDMGDPTTMIQHSIKWDNGSSLMLVQEFGRGARARLLQVHRLKPILEDKMSTQVSCTTCIHLLNHPRDEGKVCPCDGCGEKHEHYLFGDPIKARLEAERRGEVNIVIGHEGEHEVNAKWIIEEAYQNLAKRCEDVGGLVTHRNSYSLELSKPFDETGWWILEWMHGKFYRILRITQRDWWNAD